MNKIAKAKAAQIAALAKAGLPNPYESNDSVQITPASLPKIGNNYAFYKKAMDDDFARLRQYVDITDKNKAIPKRQLLGNYSAFIGDYLLGTRTGANEVIIHLMIWLFDCQDIERAIALSLKMIDQGGQLPSNFIGRNLPTFVCDSIYDWANELYKKQPQESANPYLDDIIGYIPDWDLHPAVCSKMYAMAAKHKVIEGDFTAAVAYCDKAIEVNPTGHGVKTLRENALKELKKPV